MRPLLKAAQNPVFSHLIFIVSLSFLILITELFLKTHSSARFFILMGNLTFASFMMTSSLNKSDQYILATPSDKAQPSYYLPLDFLKITLNLILISSNLVALEALSHLKILNYVKPIPYIVFVAIFMVWNSKDFKALTLEIFISFIKLESSESISFQSNMVADVWTSFARVNLFDFSRIRAELKVFLICLPYIIRMKQCFADRMTSSSSQKRMLSSINFCKYLALHSCIILNHFYNATPGITFILLFSISIFTAAAGWDLFIDWGYASQEIRKRHGLKLIAWSMLNFCLRMLPLSPLARSKGVNSLLIDGLEVIRRIVWIYWRYLNYNSSNDD